MMTDMNDTGYEEGYVNEDDGNCPPPRGEPCSDRRLTEIFTEAAKPYGYTDIGATFEPFRDFKIEHERSYKKIYFRVSDYMDCAPDQVIADVARALMDRISNERPGPYPEVTRRFLTSDGFLDIKKKIYLERKCARHDGDRENGITVHVTRSPVITKPQYSTCFKAVIAPEDADDEAVEKAVKELRMSLIEWS